MNIAIYYQGDEVWLIELPNNTKYIEFNIEEGKDWSDRVTIKRIEFYEQKL